MKRRKNRALSGYLFVWGAISVLTVGCFMLTMQSGNAAETTENRMGLTAKTKIESPGIPPIDEALPSIIKTASFGLG
jgi:hypothetical protein